MEVKEPFSRMQSTVIHDASSDSGGEDGATSRVIFYGAFLSRVIHAFLQNLQYASDDLMMLDDDSLMIPYQIGDVFISHSQEETQEMLEAAKESLEQEVKGLEERVAAIQQVLGDLKIQLYAKFGNNINLEADES
ncbi:prefoldin subunit 4-like [Cololabis saira]|uniref:prefoldin subunit 4-like n=1 Tax=Cololabis saira TaxID=129043 RepID=UPI002AD42691|nr:prefoldin subunit 4-like [Cololabis saira]